MTTHHDQIHELPIWAGDLQIAPLTGGLSNVSYSVTDAGSDRGPGGRYVARFVRDFPFHHVWRDREVIATRAAHAAGVAPELVHDQPGIMVSRFIEGKTYSKTDVAGDLPRTIDLVRAFHRDTPAHVTGAGFAFWVFHVIRDYAVTLRAADSRMSARLGEFVEIGNALEAAQVPLPISFGHHDLLPANLIDDGARLWLIDHEYAGFGTAMFDLANLTSNSGLDDRAAAEVLGLYFDRTPDRALLRAHSAMECASLLREAMWSMVSEHYLDAPGVDYVAYSDEILADTETALERYQTRFGRNRPASPL